MAMMKPRSSLPRVAFSLWRVGTFIGFTTVLLFSSRSGSPTFLFSFSLSISPRSSFAQAQFFISGIISLSLSLFSRLLSSSFSFKISRMKSKPDLALDSSSIGGRVRSKKQRSGAGPSELMDSSGSSLDLTVEVKNLSRAVTGVASLSPETDRFFFVRAGMMGWLLINLSILAKSVQDDSLSQSMILYQIFCALYILDYFVHEEYMTSTWDIIAERLGFMLVFGDLLWIPFTFSIQACNCVFDNEPVHRNFILLSSWHGWWLLHNKVQLTAPAIVANCFVFLIGYMVFRGANKQKHIFKKNPKTPIWGKPPVVVGGKLLASGYWGIARHCNYLGDLMLALSFSLPCGISSPVPYFYPIYLLILLIWRERRDEVRCAEKYKEIWAEYLRLVPYRILPYVY
ncbi:hypothetical protein F2Q70_00043806 [Brassica cretica]|uniref:Delta(14)-sterol reductase n=1 Tax=Brassica cretica TaxID=69181 RepID=A0A8S9KLD2_BRACR|nr:hypothetical protein F2Q70_00043806 [Brassica cretica]